MASGRSARLFPACHSTALRRSTWWLIAPSLGLIVSTLAFMSNAAVSPCLRLSLNQTTLSSSHYQDERLVSHPASWVLVTQTFGPSIIHLGADGLVGQSWLPDMTRPHCHMIHRTEAKRLCTFDISSQPRIAVPKGPTNVSVSRALWLTSCQKMIAVAVAMMHSTNQF